MRWSIALLVTVLECIAAQRPVVVTTSNFVVTGRPVVATKPMSTLSTSRPVATTSSSKQDITTTTLKTSTTTAATACTSTLNTYGCLPLTTQASFVDSLLAQHNSYRARHNAPALTWSNTLATAALNNAQNNANANVFVHTTQDPYGENIGVQYGYNNPAYLVYLWYNEEPSYNFSSPGFSDATGHFTQVVWLSSTQVGCAYVQAQNTLSNNGYYYLSCEYSPPGNYVGQFAQNVLPANTSPYPTAPPQFI